MTSPSKALPVVGARCRVNYEKKVLDGVITFAGTTSFADGDWIGITLDTPAGKNNGTVKEVRYFECPDGHGIFVRQKSLVEVFPVTDILQQKEMTSKLEERAPPDQVEVVKKAAAKKAEAKGKSQPKKAEPKKGVPVAELKEGEEEERSRKDIVSEPSTATMDRVLAMAQELRAVQVAQEECKKSFAELSAEVHKVSYSHEEKLENLMHEVASLRTTVTSEGTGSTPSNVVMTSSSSEDARVVAEFGATLAIQSERIEMIEKELRALPAQLHQAQKEAEAAQIAQARQLEEVSNQLQEALEALSLQTQRIRSLEEELAGRCSSSLGPSSFPSMPRAAAHGGKSAAIAQDLRTRAGLIEAEIELARLKEQLQKEQELRIHFQEQVVHQQGSASWMSWLGLDCGGRPTGPGGPQAIEVEQATPQIKVLGAPPST